MQRLVMFLTCQTIRSSPKYLPGLTSHYFQMCLNYRKYRLPHGFLKSRMSRSFLPERMYRYFRLFLRCQRFRLSLMCPTTPMFHGFPQNPKSLTNLNYRLSRRNRLNLRPLWSLTILKILKILTYRSSPTNRLNRTFHAYPWNLKNRMSPNCHQRHGFPKFRLNLRYRSFPTSLTYRLTRRFRRSRSIHLSRWCRWFHGFLTSLKTRLSHGCLNCLMCRENRQHHSLASRLFLTIRRWMRLWHWFLQTRHHQCSSRQTLRK
jgi:hypothetical protein